MIHNSKEEHDLYMNQMISNLAHDEAAFNIDTELSFRASSDVCGVLLKELDESIEALESVKKNIDDLWKMIKADWNEEEIISQFNKIAFESKLTAGEVIQVYAVALKAIEQLGGKKSETVSKNVKS